MEENIYWLAPPKQWLNNRSDDYVDLGRCWTALSCSLNHMLPVLLCTLVHYHDTWHHFQGTMFETFGEYGPSECFSSPWEWHASLEQVVDLGNAMILQLKPSLIPAMLYSGYTTAQVLSLFGADPHCNFPRCRKDASKNNICFTLPTDQDLGYWHLNGTNVWHKHNQRFEYSCLTKNIDTLELLVSIFGGNRRIQVHI